MIAHPIVTALAVWLAVALVYRWFALRSLTLLCDGSRAPAEAVPPGGEVVALRPLHGAPAGFETCQESLLRAADRAGVRVVLGVEDPGDPAAAAAERVLARHPDVRGELRVAPGPAGANRKVANLIQLSRGVDAELLLLTDADVRVPPDYVARMTLAFKDGEVGLVTGPYRSVPARTIASRLDALVTNTQFVPSTCVAARLEGVHFALGASIAVRSEALAQGGGFAALLPLAADDYGLAAQFKSDANTSSLGSWWSAVSRRIVLHTPQGFRSCASCAHDGELFSSYRARDGNCRHLANGRRTNTNSRQAWVCDAVARWW